MKTLLISLALIGSACIAQQAPPGGGNATVLVTPAGSTIASRFSLPHGYARVSARDESYAAFLRGLSLYPAGTPVRYFDGREKPNPEIYAAVLTLDRGDRDLQQCADAVMRLRAEWLWAARRYDAISFDLTSGLKADYTHWRDGFRIALSGSKAYWKKSVAPDGSYASFRAYLDAVYTYAGTRSLARQLRPVPFKDMQIGDVLIVGGSPGHAVTVMDMAVNVTGRKVFLLSQSYMPAQDIQILCNNQNPAISPWYELPESEGPIATPQWDFTTLDLKRF